VDGRVERAGTSKKLVIRWTGFHRAGTSKIGFT
jgi:hypothetical protein